MKLDSRLMAIANLVRENMVFADIGTDHAYLPVYLVEYGITPSLSYLSIIGLAVFIAVVLT